MVRTVKVRREFNGLPYWLSGRAIMPLKEARKEARRLRRKGLMARVVRRKRGASVYGRV